MLLQLSQLFFPFAPVHLVHPLPPAIPPTSLRSCPWVIGLSFLASPFPIVFLTSLCLFCCYKLRFLIPAPFPPLSLLPPN